MQHKKLLVGLHQSFSFVKAKFCIQSSWASYNMTWQQPSRPKLNKVILAALYILNCDGASKRIQTIQELEESYTMEVYILINLCRSHWYLNKHGSIVASIAQRVEVMHGLWIQSSPSPIRFRGANQADKSWDDKTMEGQEPV
jgi:hypothetical protein